jgi:hypothetical protein
LFNEYTKIDVSRSVLQNYTEAAIWKGGTLATAISNVGWHIVAVLTAISNGGRESTFSKFVICCVNLDEDKLYMKIVAFDEFYNFLV